MSNNLFKLLSSSYFDCAASIDFGHLVQLVTSSFELRLIQNFCMGLPWCVYMITTDFHSFTRFEHSQNAACTDNHSSCFMLLAFSRLKGICFWIKWPLLWTKLGMPLLHLVSLFWCWNWDPWSSKLVKTGPWNMHGPAFRFSLLKSLIYLNCIWTTWII